MTDRYAVFGNPIQHSRSPEIHGQFARQTGQDIHYERQLVEVGGFDDAASRFFAGGGKGLNVTVPFKENAFHFADKLTPRALRAGAVNTLALWDGNIILGDNTDGVGMVRDISLNLGWVIAGQRVLVLGAGGAVRGVLQPLLEQKPAALVVANRTVDKALSLAEGFCDLGKIRGCGYDDLAGQCFDLIINGTSASLGGELPPLPRDIIEPDGYCYDMMYSKTLTVFMQWALHHGASHVADGLGMLVEQAAEAFDLWRGVRPDTATVIQALRKADQP